MSNIDIILSVRGGLLQERHQEMGLMIADNEVGLARKEGSNCIGQNL